ncbi:SGNH/GDSL hydrolase family protein [Pendulispora albinea]|uniref:SGNH/GDSL hydrolase family protein n=1 Tax=Pendulispora albinea TaxID=2741071 RepID=A0ABZ2M9T9_9BACT
MAIAPLVGAILLHGGCASSSSGAAANKATDTVADATATNDVAHNVADAAAPQATPGASGAPGTLAANAGGDAGAAVRAEKRIPQTVLHVGDSTVGYYGGLSRALEARFKAEGAHYVHDVWTSASIVTFDHSDKFKKLIARHNPDLILITLGTNDVFIPSPQGFAHHVASIAKRTEGRECYWIGPPTWKKDTGIVEVIRQNAAPCKFFDSSLMKIQRRVDGIHPTDKGGETWAGLFWDFYRGEEAPLTSR